MKNRNIIVLSLLLISFNMIPGAAFGFPGDFEGSTSSPNRSRSKLEDRGSGFPTEAVNLDFERALSDEVPEGWKFDGKGIRFSIDTAVRHGGSQSLKAEWVPGKNPDGSNLMQTIDAAPYRGKHLKFKIWIKCENIAGGFGHWIAVFGPSGVLATDSLSPISSRMVRGTVDWTQKVVEVNVPPEAQRINIGLGLSINGPVWFDDGQLEAEAMQ